MSAVPQPAPTGSTQVKAAYKSWRIRVFIAAWTMYATFYLCRTNISVAVPTLETMMTPMAVGVILTATKLSYGFGQLANGILGDRFGPRRIATTGMVLSALCNIVFGLAASFPVFLAAWIMNGLVQAAGAPSRIKLLANWFSPRYRGRMMGFLGTDYVVGNAASWVLSGWLLTQFGWRWVFFVPACILLISAVHFYLRARNAPETVGLPTIEELERGQGAVSESGAAREDAHPGWDYVFKHALLNPKVWVVGFAYFGVDLFRYGFLDWSFAYLIDQGAPVGQAVLKIVMLPLAGALGIIASGWLTDRLGGRRAPVIAVMLFISAGLAWVFKVTAANPDGFFLPLALLAGIGFFLFGPHLLMGATIAMDLGSRKASASASGVIDWLGYMGAAVAGVGTAWARGIWGWDGAFTLWIGSAVLAALLMLTLWGFRTREDQEYV